MKEPENEAEEVVELRRRVAALEAELKVRDEFIIAAAHELRNPISPLVLHVQRLLGTVRAAKDDRVSATWLGGQLDLFSRRLNRLLSALNRLLDISQIRSGRMELVIEQVDLGEVVRDVVSGFEREIAASRSTLSLRADAAVVGRWDRLRLEQITANLISNAIRYGDGQPIEVSVIGTDGRAALVVRDRGIGIRDEDQARVFDRFERANARNRGGFGVGLWIVRELCAAMGGSVTLESRAGEGSTFTVTLPRVTTGEVNDTRA